MTRLTSNVSIRSKDLTTILQCNYDISSYHISSRFENQIKIFPPLNIFFVKSKLLRKVAAQKSKKNAPVLSWKWQAERSKQTPIWSSKLHTMNSALSPSLSLSLSLSFSLSLPPSLFLTLLLQSSNLTHFRSLRMKCYNFWCFANI